MSDIQANEGVSNGTNRHCINCCTSCSCEVEGIQEDISTTLGVEGADSKLVVNGPVLLDTKVLTGLIASDINRSNSIQLGKAYTKDDIAAVEEDVPAPELVERWAHLECIQAEFPTRLPGAKVGLLIGSNCPKALEPVDIVVSKSCGPFAVKDRL